MKKPIRRKLRVNGETIRSLATHELTQAAGGETVTLDTGRTVCPTAALVDSGTAACPKLGG
jgi:hypothetical protein